MHVKYISIILLIQNLFSHLTFVPLYHSYFSYFPASGNVCSCSTTYLGESNVMYLFVLKVKNWFKGSSLASLPEKKKLSIFLILFPYNYLYLFLLELY